MLGILDSKFNGLERCDIVPFAIGGMRRANPPGNGSPIDGATGQKER